MQGISVLPMELIHVIFEVHQHWHETSPLQSHIAEAAPSA
jgi:hypothetical protein